MNSLVAGLGVGCMYALLALGFAVIAHVTGIANFAQGTIAMVAAYALFSLADAGLALPLAVILALLSGAVCAALVHLIAVKPLRGEHESFTWLLSIVGVSFALEGLAGFAYGYDERVAVRLPGVKGSVDMAGVSVERLYLLMAVLLVVAVILVELLFARWHATGRALRAVAADPTSAELAGVRSARLKMAAWCAGGAIAAVAGIVSAPMLVLSPNMGHTVGLLAVIAAVVGGMGRIGLAPVIGGLLLGVTQISAQSAFGGEWTQIVSVVVLSGVLILRPQGLLPERHGRAA
ncbi:branched-chain amino acid ABC transporter permease [Spirillospora sp. NPDC048819]|uniref:branched-chain amino acid ABC transporter permease n=1 Tax=Spirillospora sp. NPDC048819 TaxID=3155268 RepID=UPI0033FBDC88